MVTASESGSNAPALAARGVGCRADVDFQRAIRNPSTTGPWEDLLVSIGPELTKVAGVGPEMRYHPWQGASPEAVGRSSLGDIALRPVGFVVFPAYNLATATI